MICTVPVSPMRAEPAHQHEIVSQLLFGEAVELLETGSKGWLRVKCCYDNYEGWVTQTHLTETPGETLFGAAIAGNWVNTVLQNGKPMHIPFGAMLPAEDHITTASFEWDFTGVKRVTPQPFSAPQFLTIANTFLNTAYMWGGRSVFGIDCSGFAQQVFKHFSIAIPRDACLQVALGEGLGFLQEAKLGDLAFFDEPDGRITHVGILLNDHEIIHASGKVRIDTIDSQGIISSDTGLRTHQLRVIKRFIPGV
ncbi:MAG: C40 family peptidase [Bacteroidota bacterium]